MKILAIGSAGCIISNLMRYMLYRSKDFKFASFDKLIMPVDYKKVYHHKNHQFYIGDACDKNFLERIVSVEKPDVIVSGLYYHKNSLGTEWTQMVTAIANLESISYYDIPVIQIGPPIDTLYDNLGIFKLIKNILVCDRLPKNVYLEVPNIFGPRQRPLCSIYNLLQETLNFNSEFFCVQEENKPWVYIEDVASYIWYVLEEKKTGHIRMPELGWKSELEMAEIINNLYNNKYKISKNQPMPNDLIEYGKPTRNNWVSDSTSIEDSLIKTVKWYDANRWVFNMYR